MFDFALSGVSTYFLLAKTVMLVNPGFVAAYGVTRAIGCKINATAYEIRQAALCLWPLQFQHHLNFILKPPPLFYGVDERPLLGTIQNLKRIGLSTASPLVVVCLKYRCIIIYILFINFQVAMPLKLTTCH